MYDQNTQGAVKVILYTNTAEPNRVNKTIFLTEIGTEYCIFREDFSISSPAITLEVVSDKYLNANYVYIPSLSRYYYVSDLIIENQQLYTFELSVDVLMSFKDDLLKLPCFIDRNEYEDDPLIRDKQLIVKEGYKLVKSYEVPSIFSGATGKSYVVSGYLLKLEEQV